jgi:glycosyltransferase involved in cell wall biosynthesis
MVQAELDRLPAGNRREYCRINILYIMDHFQGTGGTERHLTYLVENLPRDQFRCQIVVLDLAPNRWVDQIRGAGIPVIHVPVLREYAPAALLRALQIARIIRSSKVDIVQTFHQKSDTYGATIAKLSGIRHLISSKRDTGELKKARHYLANRLLAGVFERVIVVADSVGEKVIANEGIPRSRVVRIYNGVDTQWFAPPTAEQRTQARERLGFTGEDFVVGMIARFRPEKGHDILLTGALCAAAGIPSLRILAIGGGPLLESLRSRFRRECDSRRIQLLDDVTDVRTHLYAMDVGCLLPTGNEGFSNSILEKMAVGLPLIVTRVGGNSEAVIDGENGLVIPPRDVAAFQRALVTLHSDPARRLSMGQRSRQMVEQKFTVERMCREHAALYSSLMRISN